MKNFFKNALLNMLIICFILNIVNLIGQGVLQYTVIIPEMIDIAEQVSNEGISGQEGYQMIASVYFAGNGNKIEIQAGILGLSIILGIIIGLIVTFEEKSKLKIFLIYILGLLVIALFPTLFYIISDINFENLIYKFINEMLYNIEIIWKWYTLIFVFLYSIKVYINNKKTRKLNEILDNKNKTY